jgi:glycosyltransferase involved in cell wall biosynthesis
VKVLHVCASLSPEWGGPVTVISELTSALAEKGVASTVFASRGRRVGANPQSIDVECCLFPTGGLARLWTGYAPGMSQALRQAIRDHDLVHIHELWHYPHYAAYRAAQAAGKRYVVTVHGEMNPWSLRQKMPKKWLYMRAVQKRALERAAAVQAITVDEKKDIRAQGIHSPIHVIPNGINLQAFRDLPSEQTFIERFPQLNGKRIVLFLGRIHSHKGLDLLARAFARLASQHEDVRLVIAGPDEGDQSRIESMLAASGVQHKTLFTGMLTGRDKLAAYSAADVFVLPSHGEVLGVSVMEALAATLPVIITRQCQFPEVASEGAGLVINPDPDELHDALVTVLADLEMGRAMGERGRQMVMEKYTWEKVADRMRQLYAAILEGNPST